MTRSTPWPTSGGSRTPPGAGKYHNKREFVALASELGLAWPDSQRPHPVIGFSQVMLTEQTWPTTPTPWRIWGRPSGCTATPSAAWLLGPGSGQEGGEAGQERRRSAAHRGGPRRERFKVGCGCQPPRSFWIRAKQYSPGPITCGVCGQDFRPQGATWPEGHSEHHPGNEAEPQPPSVQMRLIKRQITASCC